MFDGCSRKLLQKYILAYARTSEETSSDPANRQFPPTATSQKGTSFICILNIKMMTLGFHLVCCVTWRAARYPTRRFQGFRACANCRPPYILRPSLMSIGAVGFRFVRLKKKGRSVFRSLRSMPIIISVITDAVLGCVSYLFIFIITSKSNMNIHTNMLW